MVVNAICPACNTTMQVYGHDRNLWHTDTKNNTSIQKYYVSCRCGKILEETRQLTPQKEKPGKNILKIETIAHDPKQFAMKL